MMKRRLKLTAFILTVLLLFSSTSFTVFAYEETVFETVEMVDFSYDAPAIALSSEELVTEVSSASDRYGRTILAQMENGENLVKAYDLIADGLKDLSSKIYLSYSGAYISNREFTVVYNTVMNDFPEYFWLGTSCSYSQNISGTYIIYIAPSYTMTVSEAKTASAELEKAVESFTTGLEGKSDYKKSKVLHDRISLRTEYLDTDNDQTAYGALVEHKAVCAGYARAYQLLLTRCGIPSWTVTGTSAAPGSTTYVGHAWNIVFLDGEWYNTDVTWDDQGDTGNFVFYAYFNVTTEQISEDHIASESFADYLPVCTAEDNNFFKIKGWEIESFDKATVVDSLKRYGAVGRIYVTGDLDTFKTDLKANMYSIVKELGITGSTSYNLIRLGREFRIFLNAEYKANGDANGDLKTDMKDTLIMRMLLSGMEEETEVSILNADMVSDGEITTSDILMLRKFLCGMAG